VERHVVIVSVALASFLAGALLSMASTWAASAQVTHEGFYYDSVSLSNEFAGASSIFSARWTSSAYALSGYIFGTNNTGRWVNDTWTSWGASLNVAWSNVTKTLSSAVGLKVAWNIWANNSNNQWLSVGVRWIRTVGNVQSYVGSTTNAIKFSFQRKIIEAVGVKWFFFSNGTHINFKTTIDNGATWSPQIYVRTGSDCGHFAVDTDGTYVHYAYSGATLNYRRGHLLANRTVSWNSEVIALDESNFDYRFPSISINKTGYPWISYAKYNARVTYPYVVKSNTKDGTWSTNSGFPYQLNSTSNAEWSTVTLPLQSNEMISIFGHDDEWFYSKVYSSSGWETTQTATSSLIECAQRFSATSYKDEARIVYHTFSDTLVYARRNGSGIWQSEYIISNTNLPSATAVSITTNQIGDDFTFWVNAHNVLCGRSRINGAWENAYEWASQNSTSENILTAVVSTAMKTNATAMIGYVTGSYLKCSFVPRSLDGRDIALVAKSFGTVPGDDNWNPMADVNSDGNVDGKDVAIVAKHFGMP